MKKPILKTRRGGASMFIVMFTVIILSIITLSFTRVVLAEVLKTSNTDLSQSAYDSALAGVEDAKVALLKYHACLDNGNTATSGTTECRDIIKAMQEGIKTRDCSTVSNVLKRNTNDENGVIVQEVNSSVEKHTNMLQAYTCVTIKEELQDYRTTLSSQSRLRIIPIRSADIDSIGYIRLKWFSDTNFSQIRGRDKYCSAFLYSLGSCDGSTQAPTTINVRLIQTDTTFNLSELSTSITQTRTDTGQLMLIPTKSGGSNSISADAWGDSANKADNKPNKVNCSRGTEFFCQVDIQLPRTFWNHLGRNDATTYLLVSIPYGNPETDISVMTYTTDGTSDEKFRRDFSGVQARVDSTGRANDLYRRVETRVELVDTYFAYPEFEITLTNSENDALNKSFYATFDCWNSNNGGKSTCLNSMENLTYTNL